MAWYLGADDLDALFSTGAVTPADCIDAVERSFAEHGRQAVGVMPRDILWADPARTEPRSSALKLSAAYMRESRVMGASIYAVHYTPGSVDMWLTVFSGVTGRMLGIVNGKALSVWKTAATAAVAARHMARPDARRVALIGTGSYAMAQLQFIVAAMPVDAITCYSRKVDALKTFCDRASKMLGRAVVPARSAQEAVADADVVTTITTSPRPAVSGEWLPAGVHCNVMGQHAPGAREVDTAAVVHSRVIVDSFEQAFNEKGEILIPLGEGALAREHVVGELGAVVAGTCLGRETPMQKTMFCSGGTAFEYLGLCTRLFEIAREADIGQALR